MTATVRATPSRDGRRPVWPILLGLAIVLWVTAAGFGWIGHSLDARTVAERAWPTTDGVVVRSKVSVVEYWDFIDGQTRQRDHLDFAYTYEVGSRSFEASKFDVSGAWPAGPPRAFAAAYPVGRQVQVHYDPDSPAHEGLSVEGPGQTMGFRIGAIGSGALGLVFAGFAVRSLLRRRREEP